VTDKSSVEYVIESALKQYELESKDDINKIPLISNPKCYVLRFADDDGQPDEDMPGLNFTLIPNSPLALVKTQEMGQFKGATAFSLVKDPKFKGLILINSSNFQKLWLKKSRL
jgi:hypothetical protein